MLLEKDQDKRLIVEVSDDNLQYNYLLEFRQGAFSSMAAKGVSDLEFIRSVVFGRKPLDENGGKRNFRFIFQYGKIKQIVDEQSEIFQINTHSLTHSLTDAEIKEVIRIFQTLTSKEKEVLRFHHNGHSKSRLNEELRIKKSTYKTHRAHIFEKLEVHSIEEACVWYEKYHVFFDSICS